MAKKKAKTKVSKGGGKMSFGDAIKRPFQDWKKLIIGCLLNILPIVNWLAYGYTMTAAGMTMKKNNKLPEWTGWGDLFVKGLLALILGLIYMIPALIVGFIFAGMAILGALTGAMAGGLAGGGLGAFGAGITGIVIAGLLALIAAYIVPAAILTYVKENAFGSGLHFGTVFKKAFTGRYFIAWILSIIVGIVFGFVGSFIPFIGPGIFGFPAMLIGFTLLAEAYS